GEHMNKPSLAHAMGRRWSDALRLVESTDFDNWLKRSFNDDKVSHVISRLANASTSAGPTATAKDRYISRLIIWMTEQTSICYRDIRVNVTGMATMLCNILDNRQLVNQFAEMLRSRLVQVWINEQPTLHADQLQVRRIMEEVERHLEKPSIGQGLERALYE